MPDEPDHPAEGRDSSEQINIWQRQWSWRSDRYDAYGVTVGVVIVLALGLAVGTLEAWLYGVTFGSAAANMTSFLLRRITPRGREQLRVRAMAAAEKRRRKGEDGTGG